jgi:tRNA nucleotidyltransferase/poly(A) polymerase
VESAERIFAVEVVRALQGAGYEAVFAGGCVRDELLGLTPDDYDVATSAMPEQVQSLFPRSLAVGASFGVIDVIRKASSGYLKVQVATFRNDGPYLDGRRPAGVVFSSAREDALRRDFTINGMFLDPVSGQLLDFVGGRDDLARRVLRAIGDPEQRFAEDRLRLLRAVRMASRFEMEICPETATAVKRHASAIVVVSAERIAEELRKMLKGPRRSRATRLLAEMELLARVLPEAEALLSDQETLTGALATLDRLSPDSGAIPALAVLLEGIDPAEAIPLAARLRLANQERDLLRWLLAQGRCLTESRAMRPSRLYPVLAHAGGPDLLAISRARTPGDPGVEHAARLLADLPRETLAPVPWVTGNDLISMGLKPCPAMKDLLAGLLADQMDGVLSDRDAAQAEARSRINKL